MPFVRKSRATMRTHCPDCGREVGVSRDLYVVSSGVESFGRMKEWRVVAHNHPVTNTRCTSARAIVPEEIVYRYTSPIGSG